MVDQAQRSVVFDELEQPNLHEYLDALIHSWSKTVTLLGITLIPIFFILDVFMMPSDLLPRFGVYRGATTALIIAQHLVIRSTRPSRLSFLHGYFFTIVAGAMIAMMTTDLGGFNSTYYAGLNLVLIAVNLLLPWEFKHSAINSLLLIAQYVGFNLIWPHEYEPSILVNNLYFLAGTAVISVSINFVKQQLIKQEYFLRSDLKGARDLLWGEMEVAKHIQTGLLPRSHRLDGYDVGAIMRPADEVGGDYYDVLQTRAGETWVTIGDVSGHGVESGLIMMMTQTSLLTTVNDHVGLAPSKVLCEVNSVLRTNTARLGADRYVTATAIRVEGSLLHYAGQHQDILVYRAATGAVETIETDGAWLGLVDEIAPFLKDHSFRLERGDIALLFTDGVTEAQDASKAMYGEDRLRQSLQRNANSPMDQLVQNLAREVADFAPRLLDDLTLLAMKRTS